MDFRDLKKLSIKIVFMYVMLVVITFFLMGEQLHIRESRGTVTMPSATTGTTEMAIDHTVEQEVSVKIQRITALSIMWGNYYRDNSGTAIVELWDTRDNRLILSQNIDMAELNDGQITTITADEPIEGLYEEPLLILIASPDGQLGSVATPFMTTEEQSEQTAELGELRIDGQVVEGVLCFALEGEDYIWTGLHYWEFATAAGLLLILGVLHFLHHVKQGKKSYIYNGIIAIRRYRFLIRQLVARDFKGKYKRSVLGMFWSFLNPLLTMCVQYAVFSEIFRFDIEYYPVYLICGIVLFGFFSEACGMTLTSILGNASLITKVYVPKYVYPLTRTMSSLVNLIISLIPLFVVALFAGVLPTKAYLLIPYVLLCIAVFSLGIGLILCTSMVFFRDTQFLWNVLSMIWMYLTPIFYPAEILPENIAWVLNYNPLYYFVTFMRTLVVNGVSPEPIMYIQCMLWAIGSLMVGLIVFKMNQDKFVLYI